MTTIYILVKECFAFGPVKTCIMDVSKDWDKIYNVRKKLIQTVMEDGDPFFEDKIKFIEVLRESHIYYGSLFSQKLLLLK